MGWTVTTDFYSALGDSLSSGALTWLIDLGLGRIKWWSCGRCPLRMDHTFPSSRQAKKLADCSTGQTVCKSQHDETSLWPMSDHFGNLRTCNGRRLPGLGRFENERRLNFRHMNLLNYERENSLWCALCEFPIYPDFSSNFITRGVQKLYQKIFPSSCNWKPKLVLRSKGLKIRPNIWKESDVCQNNLINAWLAKAE